MTYKSWLLLITFVLLGFWLICLAVVFHKDDSGDMLQSVVSIEVSSVAPAPTYNATPSHTPGPTMSSSYVPTRRQAGLIVPTSRSYSGQHVGSSVVALKAPIRSSYMVYDIGGGGGGAAGGGGSTSGGANSRQINTGGSYVGGGGLALAVQPIPLLAREVEGGMTAEQTLAKISPRRVVINDDDDDGYGDEVLRPNDPNDPYLTPVGDIPWGLMAALCILSVGISALRSRRKRIHNIN